MDADHIEPLEPFINQGIYDPKRLEKQILAWGRTAIAIFSGPFLLFFRRNFGTTALHPITFAITFLLTQLFCVLGYFMQQPGAFGPGALYVVFGGLIVAHGIRLRPAFLDMSKEKWSEWEGSAYPFFYRLPFASDAVVASIYEPLALVLLALVLGLTHILTPAVAIFFMLVAFAHGLHTSLRGYEEWLVKRGALDALFRANLLNQAVRPGHSAPLIHTASPAPIHSTARGELSPELARLKTDAA